MTFRLGSIRSLWCGAAALGVAVALGAIGYAAGAAAPSEV